MSSVPKKLKYSKTHEWVQQDGEVVIVGITDHAQTILGDLVYVELPEIETNIEIGHECAVVESVKAAADVYCPISGEVVEVNELLLENPQLVNEDPYGKGWLFKIRPFESDWMHDVHRLLTADQYTKQVASEAH